jgi:hypothetical protein
MSNSTLYFQTHIRPMFRRIDRNHMATRLDLWSYHDVKEHADRILELLRAGPPMTMPPLRSGGPWPEQWIDLFESWAQAGCPALPLTAGEYTAIRFSAELSAFHASIPLEDGNAEAWAEHEEPPSPDAAAFTIFLRPSGKPPSPPRTVPIRESLPGTVRSIFVRDSDGEHTLAVPDDPA